MQELHPGLKKLCVMKGGSGLHLLKAPVLKQIGEDMAKLLGTPSEALFLEILGEYAAIRIGCKIKARDLVAIDDAMSLSSLDEDEMKLLKELWKVWAPCVKKSGGVIAGGLLDEVKKEQEVAAQEAEKKGMAAVAEAYKNLGEGEFATEDNAETGATEKLDAEEASKLQGHEGLEVSDDKVGVAEETKAKKDEKEK
eukprot:5519518-Amphidinium_carterae.2